MDDVIPMLLPAVGWVAAATLVVMFPKDSWNVVCELCFVLGGTKMWLNGFHILLLYHVVYHGVQEIYSAVVESTVYIPSAEVSSYGFPGNNMVIPRDFETSRGLLFI